MQINLRKIRKAKKLSQKELGIMLNLSANSYGKKERGEVPFTADEMFLVSDFFNLGIEEIFLPRKHQNGDKMKQGA
ncbi:helix-turn-helix transcriptional regulator [Enterococcus sp. AZ102]|uniref:helix-turn-helix transcriptional regulator n=1 Tax=Enterococcus sp. AZ102 TaxID=2774865 RepID=UPI003F1FB4BA